MEEGEEITTTIHLEIGIETIIIITEIEIIFEVIIRIEETIIITIVIVETIVAEDTREISMIHIIVGMVVAIMIIIIDHHSEILIIIGIKIISNCPDICTQHLDFLQI